MEYKLVVAVREDLGLSKGKLAVQVAHAAVSCANAARARHEKWYRAWMAEGQRKVAVQVADLGHLQEVAGKAKGLGLACEVVQDAGLTEVPAGTVTCVGVGPAPDHLVDQVTGSLKLL
jgi:PTH2 family peptidyl-tRNA hydrolase